MRTRTVLASLLVMFAGAALCFAADPNLGTWKLNESKSKIPADGTKNNTVVYTAAGDSVKVTIDGVSGDGKPIHNEWTGKYDGKDYPVTGDPGSDMRSLKMVSANTFAFTVKQKGQVTITGQIKVAADGKSRTVTANRTDAKGNKTTSTAVYDKQ